jgi:hypothetical protein
MSDVILATFDSDLHFEKREKVTAFNWFEKNEPFGFGTFIKKFQESDVMQEEETCRRIDSKEMKIFNIGQYKVKSVVGSLAQITEFTRDDLGRERAKARANK